MLTLVSYQVHSSPDNQKQPKTDIFMLQERHSKAKYVFGNTPNETPRTNITIKNHLASENIIVWIWMYVQLLFLFFLETKAAQGKETHMHAGLTTLCRLVYSYWMNPTCPHLYIHTPTWYYQKYLPRMGADNWCELICMHNGVDIYLNLISFPHCRLLCQSHINPLIS